MSVIVAGAVGTGVAAAAAITAGSFINSLPMLF